MTVVIRSGQLRNYATIEQLKGTVSSSGEPLNDWSHVWSGRIAIYPVRSIERENLGKVEAKATHRIAMRWRAGIKPSMRIRFDGRAFDIISIVNVEERNRRLELQCMEVLDG